MIYTDPHSNRRACTFSPSRSWVSSSCSRHSSSWLYNIDNQVTTQVSKLTASSGSTYLGRSTCSNGCIDVYLSLWSSWLGFSCLSQQKSHDYGKSGARYLRNTSRVLAIDVLVVFANFFSVPFFFFFLSFIAKKLSNSAMLPQLATLTRSLRFT